MVFYTLRGFRVTHGLLVIKSKKESNLENQILRIEKHQIGETPSFIFQILVQWSAAWKRRPEVFVHFDYELLLHVLWTRGSVQLYLQTYSCIITFNLRVSSLSPKTTVTSKLEFIVHFRWMPIAFACCDLLSELNRISFFGQPKWKHPGGLDLLFRRYWAVCFSSVTSRVLFLCPHTHTRVCVCVCFCVGDHRLKGVVVKRITCPAYGCDRPVTNARAHTCIHTHANCDDARYYHFVLLLFSFGLLYWGHRTVRRIGSR